MFSNYYTNNVYLTYITLTVFDYLILGGYIGLFLGYALLQTPELFFKLIEWISKAFGRKYEKRNQDIERNNTSNKREVGGGINIINSVPLPIQYRPENA